MADQKRPHLLRPVVFIDACIFRRYNMNLSNKVLQALKTQVDLGHIYLLTTDVLIGELRSQVSEVIDAAHGKIDKARKAIDVLKEFAVNVDHIAMPDYDSILSKTIDTFIGFIESMMPVKLLSRNADASEIFKAYFDRRPPFGPEKKKSEFPDAFHVALLRHHADDIKQSIYIVSSDEGIAECCSPDGPLIHINDLEKFISLVLSDEKLEILLANLLAGSKSFIARISNELENCFHYVDQLEGEVYDIRAENISIDDVSLLDISDHVDEGKSFREIQISVELSADFKSRVSFADPDSSVYDREDRKLYVFNRINYDTSYSASTRVNLSIMFDEKRQSLEEINDVDFPDSFSIMVETNRSNLIDDC